MVGRIEVFPRAGAAAARCSPGGADADASRDPLRTCVIRAAGAPRIGGAHHVGVALQEDRVHPGDSRTRRGLHRRGVYWLP